MTRTLKMTVKKPNRKALIKKLDKLFSLQIRARGFCQLQGKDKVHCGGVLQCAHIIGRGRHIIRWNEHNALSLCAGHHVYYTHHPLDWHEMMEKYYPEDYKLMDQIKDFEWDRDLDKVLEKLTPKKISSVITREEVNKFRDTEIF